MGGFLTPQPSTVFLAHTVDEQCYQGIWYCIGLSKAHMPFYYVGIKIKNFITYRRAPIFWPGGIYLSLELRYKTLKSTVARWTLAAAYCSARHLADGFASKTFWLNFFNITLPHSCMCVDRVLQLPPWESCDMIIQGSSMWEPLPFGPLKTPSYNKTLNVHRQDGHGFPLVRDNSFCFFMLRCYKSALSLHRFNTFRSMDYLWFSRV